MKYSIWQNIKYRSNLSRAVVHLQGDLGHLPPLPQLSVEISVREISTDNDDDMRSWLHVVNEAYDDSAFTLGTAREYLKRHLFLNVRHVFMFDVGGSPVGTISAGVYRSNSNIGGLVRLAVRGEYQGRGLGEYLMCYGYHALRANGVRYAEGIVAIRRTRPFMLNFRCGLVPQYNPKYFTYKGQKRYWFIRYYLRRMLRKRYRDYQIQLFGSFLREE